MLLIVVKLVFFKFSNFAVLPSYIALSMVTHFALTLFQWLEDIALWALRMVGLDEVADFR